MKQYACISLSGAPTAALQHIVGVLLPQAPKSRLEVFKMPQWVFIEITDSKSPTFWVSEYSKTHPPGNVTEHYTLYSWMEKICPDDHLTVWIGGDRKGVWYTTGVKCPTHEEIKDAQYVNELDYETGLWLTKAVPENMKPIWGIFPVNIPKLIAHAQ